MDQKAFDLIVGKVEEALAGQEFKKQDGVVKEDNGSAALFIGEALAYSVFYDEEKKRFELRTCPMEGDAPTNKWKSLSMWMFDPETDNIKEAESIVNDFVETIEGPKRVAIVQQAKKRKKKDDESTNDPIFFFNRMVGVFPELKEEMNKEREVYGQVRAVSFAREKLLPKMELLAKSYPGSEPFDRMCTLLNDMYQTGDMDVRSIITMVLLNGFQDETALKSVEEKFSEDLAKSYKCGRKLKGKKVKPEKKKKQRKFTADTLNELKR